MSLPRQEISLALAVPLKDRFIAEGLGDFWEWGFKKRGFEQYDLTPSEGGPDADAGAIYGDQTFADRWRKLLGRDSVSVLVLVTRLPDELPYRDGNLEYQDLSEEPFEVDMDDYSRMVEIATDLGRATFSDVPEITPGVIPLDSSSVDRGVEQVIAHMEGQ